jgi:hypothetical protein
VTWHLGTQQRRACARRRVALACGATGWPLAGPLAGPWLAPGWPGASTAPGLLLAHLAGSAGGAVWSSTCGQR